MATYTHEISDAKLTDEVLMDWIMSCIDSIPANLQNPEPNQTEEEYAAFVAKYFRMFEGMGDGQSTKHVTIFKDGDPVFYAPIYVNEENVGYGSMVLTKPDADGSRSWFYDEEFYKQSYHNAFSTFCDSLMFGVIRGTPGEASGHNRP